MRVGVPLDAADTVVETDGVPDVVGVPVPTGVQDGVLVAVRVPVGSAVEDRVDEKDCVTEGVGACDPVAVAVIVIDTDAVRDDDPLRVPDLDPVRLLDPVLVVLTVAVPVPVPVLLDVTVAVAV